MFIFMHVFFFSSLFSEWIIGFILQEKAGPVAIRQGTDGGLGRRQTMTVHGPHRVPVGSSSTNRIQWTAINRTASQSLDARVHAWALARAFLGSSILLMDALPGYQSIASLPVASSPTCLMTALFDASYGNISWQTLCMIHVVCRHVPVGKKIIW